MEKGIIQTRKFYSLANHTPAKEEQQTQFSLSNSVTLEKNWIFGFFKVLVLKNPEIQGFSRFSRCPFQIQCFTRFSRSDIDMHLFVEKGKTGVRQEVFLTLLKDMIKQIINRRNDMILINHAYIFRI